MPLFKSKWFYFELSWTVLVLEVSMSLNSYYARIFQLQFLDKSVYGYILFRCCIVMSQLTNSFYVYTISVTILIPCSMYSSYYGGIILNGDNTSRCIYYVMCRYDLKPPILYVGIGHWGLHLTCTIHTTIFIIGRCARHVQHYVLYIISTTLVPYKERRPCF